MTTTKKSTCLRFDFSLQGGLEIVCATVNHFWDVLHQTSILAVEVGLCSGQGFLGLEKQIRMKAATIIMEI